jgi:hypothetical protein
MKMINDEIKRVAQDCSFKEPTQEQIQFVIENYDAQADSDPSGYMVLWIEQLLYDADVEKLNVK